MDHLNKQQIILLCLLVSFVTSIATGITTVSLMDQAPQDVTQTINRVVERTIEKVVDVPVPGPVTRETVVVKEDDLAISSIEKNSKSIARIKGKNSEDVDVFAGIAVIMKDDGTMIADVGTAGLYTDLRAVLSDGTEIALNFKEQKGQLAILVPKSKLDNKLTPAVIANSTPKLGQSVIALGGSSQNSVSVGVISSLGVEKIGDQSINTQISTTVSGDIVSTGSPLFVLSGEMVGIKLGSSDDKRVFASLSYVLSLADIK